MLHTAFADQTLHSLPRSVAYRAEPRTLIVSNANSGEPPSFEAIGVDICDAFASPVV